MSIEVSGVVRSFGSTRAVDHMDMSVPPGTVTGLVGPNGAGKTTLLLMLAALLAPDSGTIRVADLDPTTHPREVHQAVGWMPDAFGTWDSLTCTEILMTFAAAQLMDEPVGRQRTAEVLAAVHLEDMASTPARVLSRGQKQRLGLARAILHRPRVLLLDEPAAGMDPRSRADLRVLLRDLASQGTTVLVSSHILPELEQMIDGAVFMDRGRAARPQDPERQAAAGQADSERAAPHRVRRLWSMRALDPDALTAWATSEGLETPGADGTLRLEPGDEAAAAGLLRRAVDAGVQVTSFAPESGSLESIYLSMEGERR